MSFLGAAIGAIPGIIGAILGPSPAQKQATANETSIGSETQSFFNSWMTNASTEFGQQQNLLNNITAELNPIAMQGPNQQGFNAAELANQNTQAIDTSGAAYANEARGLANRQGAAAGGNMVLPTGAQNQQSATLASNAAGNLANEQLGITQANYAQGNANWNNAIAGLGKVASTLNPNGLAGTADQIGNTAFGQQSQLAQQAANESAATFGAFGGAATALGGLGQSIYNNWNQPPMSSGASASTWLPTGGYSGAPTGGGMLGLPVPE